jgi:hypothetical protein
LKTWLIEIQPIITGKIKSDKFHEASKSNGDLTRKGATGEVEVDHICEPLKPRNWEFGSPKVIVSKVKVSKRGEVEESRIETMAYQVQLTEVKGNDPAGGHVTGDTLPVAAVRSSSP